jgi:hypothetical protein
MAKKFRLESVELEEVDNLSQITVEIGDYGWEFREVELEGYQRIFSKVCLKRKSLKKFFLILGLENIKKIMEED